MGPLTRAHLNFVNASKGRAPKTEADWREKTFDTQQQNLADARSDTLRANAREFYNQPSVWEKILTSLIGAGGTIAGAATGSAVSNALRPKKKPPTTGGLP